MKKVEVRPGVFEEISDQAYERARKIVENQRSMFDHVDLFENVPEPKCSICGRVIYCGNLDKLCNNSPCGLKKEYK